MNIWKRFQQWITGRADRDLDRELRAHIDLEAEEQQQLGLQHDDAQFAARSSFGNATSVREDVRETWGWASLERFAQDLRYALRLMAKNPGFTTIAVLSLALGIGGSTAVFSVLDAAVLRPMPVWDPSRMVIVRPTLRGDRFVLFNPFFEEMRRRQKSFEDIFAVSDSGYWRTTFEGEAPAYVRGSKVSGNHFKTLGLTPALGRLIENADDEIAGTPESTGCALVLSHDAWQRRFAKDRGVLGKKVLIDQTDCEIVGVAPEGFQSVQAGFAPELWGAMRALTPRASLDHRTLAFFSGIMGRLRDGVTRTEAEAELTTIYQQMMAAEPREPMRINDAPPSPSDYAIQLLPGAHGLDDVAREFGKPLALVLVVVAVVLLIAAVNVANLLLARGAVRSSELATRAALGAGRGRLIRQLLTEGAVVAILGGLLGIALALVSTPALASLVSISYLPLTFDTTPDHRVLFAGLCATMIAALLAGALPALRLTGMTLQTAIAGAGRTTGNRSSQRLSRGLVGAQLALSLLLVTGAGLMLRTIVRIASIDPGFEPGQVIVFDVRHEGTAQRYRGTLAGDEAQRLILLYRALDERLNALPGVRSASLSWIGLFGGSDLWTSIKVIENNDTKEARVDYVSPRYFETVGMQVLRGRNFTMADGPNAPKVAVVNESFARERFGDEDPIGRRLVFDEQEQLAQPFTIVGLVRNSKYNDLRESKTEPMVWTPLPQAPIRINAVSLRVEPGTQMAVVREAQRAIVEADPLLMIRKQTTLSAQVAGSTLRERLLLGLASAFGGLALLLAAIGLYGTLAHAVARRTREIGIRLALGARASSVLRMVVRDALRLAMWGLIVGIPLSLAAGYALRSFLFGVEPYDLVTLIGSGSVLTLVATLAAYVPARRASRVNPIEALRYE